MSTTNELLKYEDYFDNITKALITLKSDLELAEQGWTLHFAIDFAELFAFAFPLTQISHMSRKPRESETDAHSREQATLTILFANWKEQILTNVQSLILLPPYLEELRTALRFIQYKRVDAYSWPGIMDELQKGSSKESYKKIAEIVKRYRETGRAPDSDSERNAIATYIGTEYPDVVSSLLTTTDSRVGLSVLRTVVDAGTVQSGQSHFPKHHQLQLGKKLYLDDIWEERFFKQRSEEWLPSFNEKRPDREVANIFDAQACAITSAINERLLEHKAVLLIISHSRAVRDVTKTVALATGAYNKSESKTGVRDLDYLWLYYVHKENNRKATLQRINDNLELLNQLAVSRKMLKNETEVKKEHLSKAHEIVDKCSNFSLSATTVDPLLKWLDSIKNPNLWSYPKNAEVSSAILKMIREGGMAQELVERRNYEHERFELLIQEMTDNLDGRTAK